MRLYFDHSLTWLACYLSPRQSLAEIADDVDYEVRA
jgi:hypothetical protein